MFIVVTKIIRLQNLFFYVEIIFIKVISRSNISACLFLKIFFVFEYKCMHLFSKTKCIFKYKCMVYKFMRGDTVR